ncbi:hypothetical protein SAMN05443999_103174 [Roseovarius azorensis]|uniref:Uncharacterized protein n=1 Tax=Roseovarius azorensis TaxID=1287727 RepID=A0A1H7M1X6_9RHOB|nr:hypothetical protein SAMN05443999_103174 [Roseovarius azorensis]
MARCAILRHRIGSLVRHYMQRLAFHDGLCDEAKREIFFLKRL